MRAQPRRTLGSQTLGNINKGAGSTVLPHKQAWVLPRFKYLLLDMGRQEAPLELPEGPQPPGGLRGRLKG